MRKYYLYIVFLLFFVNTAFSQIIPPVDTAAMRIDSINFEQKIEGNDTIFNLIPFVDDILIQTNSTRSVKSVSEEAFTAKTALYSGMSLSNIPTSVTVDKTKDIGEIPIKSNISNGTVSYSVPIENYPNSKGINPEISLTYNSMSGPGVAGYGWNIGGISNISITHSNYYYDGLAAKSAEVTRQSAYSLDGIRLIKLTENTTLATYQTEQGNIKITDNAPSGKYYFDVLYPDGRKAVFGIKTTTTAKMSYPLTRMEDQLGNYIEYNYSESNNIYTVTEVKYGNTGGIIGTIKFTYSARNDARMLYTGGAAAKQDKLLTKIDTYYQAILLRTYTLTYENKEYNFLTKIHCKSDTKELNPLTFYYGGNESNGGLNKSGATMLESYFANSKAPDMVFNKGKFNNLVTGEGLIAYPRFSPYAVTAYDNKGNSLYGSSYSSTQTLLIFKNLESYVSSVIKLQTGEGFQSLTAVDIDGDGNDEIVKINYTWENNMGKVALTTYDKNMTASTKSLLIEGAFAEGSLRSPLPRYFVYGDFNGDGKIELLTIYGHKSPTGSDNRSSSRATLVNLETKTVISETFLPPIDYFKDQVFALDHNGDGRSEICHIGSDGTHIYESVNNTFTKIGTTYDLNRSVLSTTKEMLFGDINGDGMTDILISPGTNLFKLEKPHYGPCYGCCNIYNGTKIGSSADGVIQVYQCKGSSNYCQFEDREVKKYLAGSDQWTLLSANGKGFTKSTISILNCDQGMGFILQDINGDKLPDLVVKSSTQIAAYLNKNGAISSSSESTKVNVQSDAHFITGSVGNGYGYGTRTSQLLSIKDAEVTPISFSRNDAQQRLLTGIANSHGTVTTHSYENLTGGNVYWTTSASYTYPYSRLFMDLNVVRSTDTYNNGIIIGSVNYTYQDAVIHKQGLGFRGFGKTIISDYIQGITYTQIFDPVNFGVLKSSDSQLSSETYNYSISIAANKIATVTLSNKTEKDKLKDISVTTTFTYDSYSNPTKEVADYGGGLKTTVDNKYNNLTGTPYILGQLAEKAVTNERGGTSALTKMVFTYNTKGQTISKKDYYGTNQTSEESYVYDVNNNLTESKTKTYTSTNWLSTKYAYDSFGRVTRETDPMGLYKDYVYSTKGELSSVKNHKTQEIKYEYDVWARGIKTTFPNGVVETMIMSWAASPAGALVLSTKSVTGEPTTQVYVDALNREVRTGEMRFDGKYLYTDKVYDTKGRLQKESLPFKGSAATQWNTFNYDTYNRITSLAYASGKKDEYSYTKNTITSKLDGISKTISYDATDKMISVTDPAGTISYSYRADGQPLSIVAPGSITTSFEYDGYGRQTALVDPSSGKKSFTYDASGNINQETDARGKVIKRGFDTYNRLTSEEVVGELTNTIVFNTDGLPTGVTTKNTGGTVLYAKTYTYDNLMRILTEKETVVDGKWIEKTYVYSSGNKSSIAYKSNTSGTGNIVTENYVYANGHLSEIKLNNTTSIWKLTQENDMGLGTSATTGALTRTYSYDVYGMPTARVIKNATTTIQNFGYNFTPATGNLNWRKDNNRNIQENFTYDNLNRLTSFGGKTITYDIKGNITDHSGVGKFEYKHSTKPYAITDVTFYGTDVPRRNQTIVYNGMMRPTSIIEREAGATTGGYEATFTYNGNGERVKMQIKNGQTDQLIRYYIGDQYEVDAGAGGNKERLYLGGDAYSAAAVYIKEGTGAWTVYYLGRDYLGSITHIIDAAGAVKQELSYDPWGRLRNPVNQQLYAVDSEPALLLGRGYTGHEHLQMFGLINMNARLYDPVVGRFLSPDPYVQAPDWSQNFNRYSYALNNPLRFNDASGKFLHIVIGAVVGGVINWASNGFKFNAKGLASFAVGAAIGAGTAALGGITAGFVQALGIVPGAAVGAGVGAVTGAASSVALNGMNNVINGQSFGANFGKSLASGAISGAITGAIGGGMKGYKNAKAKGANVWSGDKEVGPPKTYKVAVKQGVPLQTDPTRECYTNSLEYADNGHGNMKANDFLRANNNAPGGDPSIVADKANISGKVNAKMNLSGEEWAQLGPGLEASKTEIIGVIGNDINAGHTVNVIEITVQEKLKVFGGGSKWILDSTRAWNPIGGVVETQHSFMKITWIRYK